MTEKMKEVLERTERTLCRHLEDLNDEVDNDGGRIKNHMVLDGIKDCLKSLKCKKDLSEDMTAGAAKSAAPTATAAK